ncbi:MAG: dockerin type I repeat-containing protein [Clostridiales bacterium]|nr:dockerin type I repeat-containing protein [Clostridiales bacterium]
MKNKKTNRVISFILAFAMLLSVCALNVGAATADNSSAVVFGDVNGDGKVNFIDSFLLFFARIGVYHLNETQKLAADVNGDGKIDREDGKLLRRFVNHTIPCFPFEEGLWDEGTVIETEYDENGKPVLAAMELFKNQQVGTLQHTISGTLIYTAGKSYVAADMEIGIKDLDIYADIIGRRIRSDSVDIKLRTNVARIRLIEKGFEHFYIVIPAASTYAYYDLKEQADYDVAQLQSLFETYGEEIRQWLSVDLVSSLPSIYDHSSVVEIGNQKYLCETYQGFRLFFAEDGTLVRFQLYSENSNNTNTAFIVRSYSTSVDASKFNLPKLYRKVSMEEALKSFQKLAGVK